MVKNKKNNHMHLWVLCGGSFMPFCDIHNVFTLECLISFPFSSHSLIHTLVESLEPKIFLNPTKSTKIKRLLFFNEGFFLGNMCQLDIN